MSLGSQSSSSSAVATHNLSVTVSGADRISQVATVNKIIWNELLAYVAYCRNNSTVNALIDVVSKHFSAADISEAKRLLVQEFQSAVDVGQFTAERRKSAVRSACDAEIDDILGILHSVDEDQSLALDGYVFVASDFKQLPKFGPEELNVAAVVDRQATIEASVQQLTKTVQQLSASSAPDPGEVAARQAAADALSKEMRDFNKSANTRLDQLSNICSHMSQSVQSVQDAVAQFNQRPSPRAVQPDDRALNVVVFGVPEDRSAAVWRKSVDDAFNHVLGHAADVADMFRAGRFATGKTRPVIVKLRTAWDRRLLLANRTKLKDFTACKLFLSADEPLEVRRKRTLEHWKSRAEHDGKRVEVRNDVLLIDGNAVFSLQDGKLN